ncbi:MAG TPA: ketoacyl-ACP synthase III [Nonomuraea sp.]|uniref:3-oxoacyl-ACP synthase III family protein n=1 Tax=Nonomuraea sp. NPDC049649 TaxID=3155776 RepID=UPI002BC53854|nr:ketoacyl-ACP synthase III [Nonomuraea sp.]
MGAHVGILATGSYLPKEEVGNEELAAGAGVTPEWIVAKTGILSRRFASAGETTADLAVRAAQRALEGLDPAELGHVIVSTSTADSPQPPVSAVVQHAIGATGAACFDLNAVCSGFVYGLALARDLVAAHGRPVLVVAADVYSRILDFSDRRTAVLFGDGSGAAVVGPAPAGFLGFQLASDGSGQGLIRVEGGFFRMEGRRVKEFVLERVPPALAALAARHGRRLADVDVFIPHQANGVLVGELAERAGLGGARMPRTVDRFGNVGSASVAVTLDEANRTGMLRQGDLVLLAGFGGGMAIGAGLLRWAAPEEER